MQVHFQVKSVQRVQRVGKKKEERLNNSTKNLFAVHFQGVQRVKRVAEIEKDIRKMRH